MLNEDLKVRDYLKKKLAHASVGRVIIERPAKDARITIHSARPGVVIGKKGEDIEMLKADLRKLLGVQMVHVNIEEIRKPEVDAQLIADSIAQQLEKRIMFRRAMKRAMQNAMRLGAQGIKIMSAGRLNGIEIARTEWYREGRVPLHTLRADIDYGFSEAKTTYGVIGIKCGCTRARRWPRASSLRRARGAGRTRLLAAEEGEEARARPVASRGEKFRAQPAAPRRADAEAPAAPAEAKAKPAPRARPARKKAAAESTPRRKADGQNRTRSRRPQ